MSTPASPGLTVAASSDKPTYAPGDVITVTATADTTQDDSITISATLNGVTVNATVDVQVTGEPASGAQFGISDSLNLSWSQQQGANPGQAVFTATLPAAA